MTCRPQPGSQDQMATTTVHNPTNFEPADYEVLDYLDTQPPTVIDWSGGSAPHAAAQFAREGDSREILPNQ